MQTKSQTASTTPEEFTDTGVIRFQRASNAAAGRFNADFIRVTELDDRITKSRGGAPLTVPHASGEVVLAKMANGAAIAKPFADLDKAHEAAAAAGGRVIGHGPYFVRVRL
jgi:hypothetical protein